MKRLIITNGKIILPTSIETDKILICINQKIRQIVASNEFTPQPDDQIIDAAGNYVAPGFIDMHIHGGGVRFHGWHRRGISRHSRNSCEIWNHFHGSHYTDML